MNEPIRSLEPVALWNHFADLNAIPRPSKKEARVIAFMKAYGEALQLDTVVDSAGNVIIRKPASAGMEDRQPVVLQSHLDMVHQKNADTDFDFETQGINMYVDGDWVRARGTTLGADNGIGVASIMSILGASDIAHPPLEALFTTDEETGLTGATALEGGVLHGSILLNLDTESDNELTIGCAGGVDVTATGTYPEVPPTGNKALTLSVTGLTGGHSGGDIHLGKGNANKIMNRILLRLTRDFGVGIAGISGGGLRNAIPRESVAVVTFDLIKEVNVRATIEQMAALITDEYRVTDPNIMITTGDAPLPAAVMEAAFQLQLLQAVYACPNGIYRMSPEISGLVQSSNNLARVIVSGGSYSVQCLTRSSVESEKTDLATAISSAFGLIGARVACDSDYPGWQPRTDAPIVQLMTHLYSELFHDEIHVMAVHAGLECGILGIHYPALQMVSFGPNIRNAHSPDECAQVSSVQKFWRYLLEILKRIPVKA